MCQTKTKFKNSFDEV